LTSFYSVHSATLPRLHTIKKLAPREAASGSTMSKSEIQSWIASNSSDDPENGEISADGWQRDRVLTEWPRSIEVARGKLMTNKTKIRISFLQDELLSLARHGGTLSFSIPWILMAILNIVMVKI
jgi:hypothetical protein